MDKQMIEEMEKTLYDYYFHYDDCIGGSERYLAKYLIEKGWIKPAENAVVLTREEHIAILKDLADSNEKAKEIARKETAEKFAERLKEKLEENVPFVGYDLEDCEFDGETIQECIDEICKEITEGKGNENG